MSESRYSWNVSHPGLHELQRTIEPIREKILAHDVYNSLNELDDVVVFIAGRAVESHPGAGPLAALACAVAGPVIAVATGALLGDPRTGVPMLTTTLPQAVLYNLLAASPVVWVVRRLVCGPEPRPVQVLGYVMRSRL
ncbi:hypothetical protein ACWCSH_02655 [Streptosporangium sp. NPDC001682]